MKRHRHFVTSSFTYMQIYHFTPGYSQQTSIKWLTPFWQQSLYQHTKPRCRNIRRTSFFLHFSCHLHSRFVQTCVRSRPFNAIKLCICIEFKQNLILIWSPLFELMLLLSRAVRSIRSAADIESFWVRFNDAIEHGCLGIAQRAPRLTICFI